MGWGTRLPIGGYLWTTCRPMDNHLGTLLDQLVTTDHPPDDYWRCILVACGQHVSILAMMKKRCPTLQIMQFFLTLFKRGWRVQPHVKEYRFTRHFYMELAWDWNRIYLNLTQKDSITYNIRVELFRLKGIFYIVSSDPCLISSNLRAVQSASQSVKKIYQMLKTRVGGVKGVLIMTILTNFLSKSFKPFPSF